MRIRRAIAVYLAMILAVVALAAAATLLRSPEVSACTWSVEHTNTVGKAFYSSWYGGIDTLYVRITTYAGGLGLGCAGYKYYLSEQWTAHGTPGTYHTVARKWVCGTYYGAWSSDTASVTSQSSKYPAGCLRQADNSGSWFYDTADAATISQYVNQG